MTANAVVQVFHKIGQGPDPAPAPNPQPSETGSASAQPSSAELIAEMKRLIDSGELNPDASPDTAKPIGGGYAPQAAPTVRPWGEIPPQAPIYYEGDQRARYDRGGHVLPAGMSEEDTYLVQRMLVAAGLLRGEFRKGIWDKKSSGAFKDLLGFANQERLEWAEALNVYASSPSSEGPDVEGFLPARYQAMDPERVKQEIQTFSESRLDRMLSEAELNEMYAVYTKADRQGFQAQQAAQEDAFNQQMGVAVEGDLPDQVEPLAVMRSVFEKKYAPAIEATESTRERDARAPGLRTVGSTVSEMI